MDLTLFVYTCQHKKSCYTADANIIGSHFIFKGKWDSKANAQIDPWEQFDKEKDFIRRDDPSVSL